MKRFLLILFFFSTLTLVLGTPHVSNSPDERANTIFAELFAEEQSLEISEPLNLTTGLGIVYPRSTIPFHDSIVPGSFIGFQVLTGAIGFVVGSWSIELATPLLAVLAILAWHSTIRKLFKHDRLADLSAFFLMIHPAFWYYTGRTMMHNVAFLAALVFVLWFVVVQPFKRWSWPDWSNFVGAGAFFALALAIRTSEALWMAAIALLLLWWSRQRVTWGQRIIFVGVCLIALLPLGLLQQNVYGSVWANGYTTNYNYSQDRDDGDPVDDTAYLLVETTFEKLAGAVGGAGERVADVLFPFGIHEANILRNVRDYGFLLYPWMSLLALAGGMIVLARKDTRWRRLLWITLGLAVWLGIVYGSWSFSDSPDPSAMSIGNSHVRYWLPLFLLSTPFCALALQSLSEKMSEKLGDRMVWGVGALCVLLSSLAVFAGDDGLLSTRARLFDYEQAREVILSETDADDVIIVDHADKYLFPDRSVIVPLRDETNYNAINVLLTQVDLYYFGITLPPEDVAYLNEDRLVSEGARIDPVVTVDEETLYRISAVE